MKKMNKVKTSKKIKKLKNIFWYTKKGGKNIWSKIKDFREANISFLKYFQIVSIRNQKEANKFRIRLVKSE